MADLVPVPPGPRLSGGHSLHETSTVLVETVTRGGTTAARGPPAFGGLPKFSSDAGKVVARGPGLSTAYLGQKNHFTVDCSKAGELWGLPWGSPGYWEGRRWVSRGVLRVLRWSRWGGDGSLG